MTRCIQYSTIRTKIGVDAMTEQYNQNYTQEEIDVILQKIKDCVNDNKYTISQNENRQENIQFINEYRLDKPWL